MPRATVVDEKEVVRFGVSIPRSLLKEFDRVSREIGFANRSEAIRAAIRELIAKHKSIGEKKANIGVIAVIYDHKEKGCEEEITDIQHKYSDVVVNASHIHLNDECLETITCVGDGERIKKLYMELRAVKGVKWAETILTWYIKARKTPKHV